jgi:DNA-binding MarR family transcriptional regulator
MNLEEELKISRKLETNEALFISIIYSAKYLEKLHVPIFKKYKLSESHYNVLRILRGKYPKHHTPTSIKEVMIDKTKDLTRLVDKLYKNNYVERWQCSENRRQTNIKITEEGISLMKTIDEEMNALNGIGDHLSEDKKQQIIHLLKEFRNKP